MTQRRRPPQRRPAPQQQRRRSVRRKRRTPKSHILPWLIVFAVAFLALWLTLTNYVFVVRDVEVVGAGSVAEDSVMRVCGIRLGSKLKDLDPEVVKANVDATGVLAYVSVEPRYPVAVRLTVRERSRDAMIMQTGKLLLLDSDGYVISASDSAPEETVPYVIGLKPTTYRLGRQLDATPGRLEAMKAVLEALKEKGATDYVSELDVEYPANIQIITRTGMTVLLGDSQDMPRKIAWMAGALADLESRGETLGRLDVSSGTRADFLPMVIATPTPAPTQNLYLLNTPTPEPTEVPAEDGAVIGEDAI